MCFAIILGLLTAGTLLLEIYKSGTNTTKVETTLFGALQFIFSIGFAWLIATIVSEKEFLRSQKHFAIAAFRRIKEIEKAVQRLLLRTSERQDNASEDTIQELKVIREISMGISETIKSSIADWADIIGEELETIHEIEELKIEQEAVISDSLPNDKQDIEKIKADLKRNEEKLTDLIKSLPHSLQTITKPSHDYEESVNRCALTLRKEIEEKGFVKLHGFSAPAFGRDIWDFSEGDRLFVSIDDLPPSRIGVLVVKDHKQKKVGMITNHLELPYTCGVKAITKALGKSNFEIEITRISKKAARSERHYFEAKTVD